MNLTIEKYTICNVRKLENGTIYTLEGNNTLELVSIDYDGFSSFMSSEFGATPELKMWKKIYVLRDEFGTIVGVSSDKRNVYILRNTYTLENDKVLARFDENTSYLRNKHNSSVEQTSKKARETVLKLENRRK